MKLLPVILAAILVIAPSDGQNLDELIGQVFHSSTVGPVSEKGGPPEAAGGDGAASEDCTGECVPYYLCSTNNTIITDGVGLIDIRLKDGPCENYLEICCAAADVREPNNPIKPSTTTVRPPGPGEPHPEPVKQGCGFRNPEGVGFRITGNNDNEAQFGEFPWMVAVLREDAVDGKNEKINVYQCGGSLIHPKVVLTAAHCIFNKPTNALKIRAGEWDTQTKNELFPHQDRDVESVEIHKDYYAGALFHDVALLFLREPVDLAENVAVACLPKQGDVLDGSRCFATGWGKDVFGKDGRYQVILKRVELPIMPRPKCIEALRKTRLGKHFELHQSFICAGGEPGKDTCKGDGGSPLVCPIPGHPNRYQQAGIVAWGIGCGENNTPGVYVNVPLFRDWINEQLVYNNLDLSYYNY